MSFNRFFNYSSLNFSYLNHYVSEISSQNKIYQRLSENFSANLKESDNIDIFIWDLRIKKSLKQIFTSSTFFVESEIARKNNLLSSHFYLSYYSLFHSFLSVLYLEPSLNIDKLIIMPHNKVLNNFVSLFSNGKRSLISNNIQFEFETLRFFREYYSYSMPFNEFFSTHNYLPKPEAFLKDRITHCFQIASLLSSILEKKGLSAYIDNEDINLYKLWFNKIFGKVNPFDNKYILDLADKNMRNEVIKDKGATFVSFIIILEHFIDEYDTYYSDYKETDISNQPQIVSLLYDALIT